MGRKRSQSLRRIPFYNSISVLRINIQKGDKVPGCKWKKASLKSKYCYPRYYLVTKLLQLSNLTYLGGENLNRDITIIRLACGNIYGIFLINYRCKNGKLQLLKERPTISKFHHPFSSCHKSVLASVMS